MAYYSDKYEAVIGLEVHAQLLTVSKLFVADAATYGSAPNTQISPITLAHPGTLPKLNKKAIELAIRMGLACHCEIERINYFARKHYFYPDLPKGYQLTQHTTPICKGGLVRIPYGDTTRDIRLNRIHLEEDAGKSIHDRHESYTAVDHNRAGVPLIEIVSEPDLHSGEEASAYLTVIRQIVRALGVSDGNMEEGSLRCDANISIRLKGEQQLGTKVEVKNLNSIRYLRKAIDHEVMRMIDLKEKGGMIVQQTRSFDADKGTTFAIRTKEDANDYRYFSDPDLPPFVVTDETIRDIRSAMPELPDQRKQRFILQYGLSDYDAFQLSQSAAVSGYYEQVVGILPSYKTVANWVIGPVRAAWEDPDGEAFQLPAVVLTQLIKMVEDGSVSHTAAVQHLFPVLLRDPQTDPFQLAKNLNMIQERDTNTLQALVDEVLLAFPEKVQEYKKGKKGLTGLFVGEVMKRSGGKADPKLVQQLLVSGLSQK